MPRCDLRSVRPSITQDGGTCPWPTTSRDGDLLLGAQPIAQFLTQLFDGKKITATDVYNWCSRGALPHSKLVGSKTRICEHFCAPISAQAFSPRRR
jgi:hypothetical protein